jgi:periplasmic protein TonB
MQARTAAAWSVAAHAAVIVAAVVFTSLNAPPARPPAYAVELVAAPPGPRAIGSVKQGPQAAQAPQPKPTTTPDDTPETPPDRTAVPSTAAAVPKPKPAPSTAAPVAKPTPTPTPRATAPSGGGATRVNGPTPAGGGPTGGRGRDVASVKVQGIAFPYPGYLENITRQIALNFKPRPGVALRAEVTFLIHRDGSVSDLRMVSRSGVYAFDLECLGAVEAVGQRRSFGALPPGFRDDVLPVVFSFDPSVLR